LLRTSPGEAWADFLASPYEVADGVTKALSWVGVLFGVIYLVAVSMAGLLIVRIARSTARLSRGAREVAAGNLQWRIPGRRRDQLGDLAGAFNQMASSIESMLAQVAEKERLTREVELAREIQESLLPSPELTHGELQVVGLFRPASEVGGDLFDLFPGAEGRLAVVVGDVAGHGLPTGLLMAMVKAGVATLVQDGHGGPELADRLNRLLLAQPVRRRMVTLALAEIDPAAGTLELTSAGHPPPFLITPAGSVEELLQPSLPLGRSWIGRSPHRTVSFPGGSILVLYSDGLVEARNPGGEEFGFRRLETALAGLAHRSPRCL
jgi:sigma-B regulation protein RsbU (phosphoserine phosphatase)